MAKKPKEPNMSSDPMSREEDKVQGDSSRSADALRERLVGVLDEYFKAIQEISSAQFERLSAPYQDYQRAVAEAQGRPDAAKALQAAYVEQLHRIVDQVGGSESEDAASQAQHAYAGYLNAVAEVLASLPSEGGHETLPPAILAGLGQHFLLVAHLAGSTGAIDPSGGIGGKL
jgi:hypothetical protein